MSRFAVVARKVAKLTAKRHPRLLVDGPFAFRLERAFRELLERHWRARDADDRHVELAAAHESGKRREDLAVGAISGGAEEDEDVGARGASGRPRRCETIESNERGEPSEDGSACLHGYRLGRRGVTRITS